MLAGVSLPAAASAQEWRGDPCREARHEAGRNGTVAGGVLGALIGQPGGGPRLAHHAGAIIGGTVGAVAGHNIGAHSIQCRSYPAGYRYHAGCHWVTDSYHGEAHSYEVCRDRDGYWRPYRNHY